MLKCLQSLEEASLVSQFPVSIAYTDSSQFIGDQAFVDQLAPSGRALGWNTLAPGLQTIFQKLSSNVTASYDFLTKLVPFDQPSSVTDQQKQVFQGLLMILIRPFVLSKTHPTPFVHITLQKEHPGHTLLYNVLNLLAEAWSSS